MSPAEPRPVRRGLPAQLVPIGDPPAAGPLDELGRARIRRQLAQYLGDFPTLDSHVALLDSRGAWYAQHALGAWTTTNPDSFFGLIRHVVLTQLAGPAPDPDLETWLAAGRPQDAALGSAWDTLNCHRYHATRRVATTTRGAITPSVAAFDAILTSWPDGQLPRFVLADASLESVLERRSIVLPPIDS